VPGPLRVHRVGAVLVVTMDRPEVRNAVNGGLAEALGRAWDAFEADDALHVAVLTGAEPVFCAGMDLKAFIAGEDITYADRGFAGTVDRPPAKPVVAAVEGAALGGGLELMLACDLVVAANNALFGLPETRLGLVALAGGLRELPRRIPYQLAMEMALTAAPIMAGRAYSAGLINRLTGPGEALGAAIELATTIAANGPVAVQASKRLLRSTVRTTDLEARALELLLREQVGGTTPTPGVAGFLKPDRQ
jgi:enoyl-CoA hydratase